MNWALGRNLGWRIQMRMEDLDAPRVRPDAVHDILSSLEWLGVDWDGEVVHQSHSLEPYLDAMKQLAFRGRIFESPHSRSQARSAASAPHAGDQSWAFPRSLRPPLGEAWAFSRQDVNHRFRVDDGELEIIDEIAGACRLHPSRSDGDFIVWTKAGVPAYQLAVVVDDARAGVTDVVRGDDLLTSAALQALLYRALERPAPRWWHLPLILDDRGERMAKRGGATALSSLRDAGVPRERVIGLIAWWCGMIPGRRPVDPQEFCSLVSRDSLQAWHTRARGDGGLRGDPGPPRFDDDARRWLEGSHV